MIEEMTLLKVLVTGTAGMLGQEIESVFKKKNEVIGIDLALKGRNSVDITKPEQVINFIKQEMPDLVIHCIGLRDVDECENNRNKALLVNTIGTKNVALATKMIDCPMVHISSDSVFAGDESKAPYTELDRPNPVNFYGYTKWKAEEIVSSLVNKYYIIRVPLLFGNKGNKKENMIHQVCENLQKGEKVYGAADILTKPIWTRDLAEVLLQITQSDYYGIYHIPSNGPLASRYDIMLEIAKIKGLDVTNIVKVKAEDTKIAKRPYCNYFNGIAFKNAFKIKLDDWRNSLKKCINEMEA